MFLKTKRINVIDDEDSDSDDSVSIIGPTQHTSDSDSDSQSIPQQDYHSDSYIKSQEIIGPTEDAYAQNNVGIMDDYDSDGTYCEEAELRMYRKNQ